MFATFRLMREAIVGLTGALNQCSASLQSAKIAPTDADALADRVAALEHTMQLKLAESQALLVEAKADRRNARSAEERTRRHADRLAESLEGSGDDGEDGEHGEHPGAVAFDGAEHGAHGGAPGLLPVHPGLAPNASSAALKNYAALFKRR
jgi:hypothetical protein